MNGTKWGFGIEQTEVGLASTTRFAGASVTPHEGTASIHELVNLLQHYLNHPGPVMARES